MPKMTIPERKFDATFRFSRWGIASFAIGVLVPLLILALILVLFSLIKLGKGSSGYSLSQYVVLGLKILFFSAPVFHFAGSLLGVTGWFSKKTENVFPILGTIINVVLLLGWIILVILGFFLWAVLQTPWR